MRRQLRKKWENMQKNMIEAGKWSFAFRETHTHIVFWFAPFSLSPCLSSIFLILSSPDFRCKRGTGRGGGSSSSGITSSSSNSSSSGGPIPISNSNNSNSSGGGNNHNSGGSGSGKSSSYRSEKSNRPSRIPFHKRRLTVPFSGLLLARSQHQHHQTSNSNRHHHGATIKSRQDSSTKAAGFSSSSSPNTTSRPPMFNVSQRLVPCKIAKETESR